MATSPLGVKIVNHKTAVGAEIGGNCAKVLFKSYFSAKGAQINEFSAQMLHDPMIGHPWH
jgi:hypothetical protein